jgi:hypothetical protein
MSQFKTVFHCVEEFVGKQHFKKFNKSSRNTSLMVKNHTSHSNTDTLKII